MMHPLNRLARVAKIAAAIVVLASPAAAQTRAAPPAAQAPIGLGTPAFAQLVQGRSVVVTSTDGSQRQGRVTSLSSTGMTVDGKAVLFTQVAKVQEVSHRVRNGALAGLGLGIGVGLFAYAGTDCEAPVDQGCGQVFGYAAIGTVAGVVAGAIMNHQLKDRDVIYSAPKRTTTIAFAPIVSPTRKGVTFRVTWR